MKTGAHYWNKSRKEGFNREQLRGRKSGLTLRGPAGQRNAWDNFSALHPNGSRGLSPCCANNFSPFIFFFLEKYLQAISLERYTKNYKIRKNFLWSEKQNKRQLMRKLYRLYLCLNHLMTISEDFSKLQEIPDAVNY